MNAIPPGSNYANVITPFAASSRADISHPLHAEPIAPVNQPEAIDKLAERDDSQTPPDAGNPEELSAENGSEFESLFADRINSAAAQGQLSEQELATLQKLRARDQEVREHERAHQAVGGQHAGAATFEYERGPDGARYAVSGEVPIQLPSGDGSPEQRIRQAEQVIRAALAPVQPSAQDRQVAARAAQLKQEAEVELREVRVSDRCEDEANETVGVTANLEGLSKADE